MWTFPAGEKIWLSHLQEEKDIQAHQSAEYQFIGFDELTHFTERQYLYLGFSRMRSSHGVPLRLRAGTNPGSDGHEWVFRRFAPWLDPECEVRGQFGVPLHFVIGVDEIETIVPKGTPGAVSRTFVPALVRDNPHIPQSYVTELNRLQLVDRLQLRDGNWLVKPGRGMYFKRGWFKSVPVGPASGERIRYWDRAGTAETEGAKRKKTGPDWTVGLKLCKSDGVYYVEHVVRLRGTPHDVQNVVQETAKIDGKHVQIGIEQDPGQAGIADADAYVRLLDGYDVRRYPARQDKITRCKPASAQAEGGNFRIVEGTWNQVFLDELESFPEGSHDDQVDALSGAHTSLKAVVESSPPLKFEDNIREDSGY